MTEEEEERASLLLGTLESHVQENSAQFILGQCSLDEWDAFVSELDGLGMSDYVALRRSGEPLEAGRRHELGRVRV